MKSGLHLAVGDLATKRSDHLVGAGLFSNCHSSRGETRRLTAAEFPEADFWPGVVSHPSRRDLLRIAREPAAVHPTEIRLD